MTKVYIKLLSNDVSIDFLISSLKKDKLDRCSNEKRIRELIQGEKLLINCLNDLSIPYVLPLDIKLNEHGKPILMNSPISFNISHSKNFISCAISTSEVGIDIEEFDENHEKVREKLFSNNEKNKFTATNDVIKLWTIKEAYLKMNGTGLINELNSLDTKFLRTIQNYDIYSIDGVSVCNMINEKFSISIATKDNDSDVFIKFLK